MNQIQHVKAALAVAALLAFPFAHAANMTKPDYHSAKDQIKATYKTEKAACKDMKANAKDICIEEAKGKEKVALAELEFKYTGKPADGNKVGFAKAEAGYKVAKEKCDDLKGNEKDVCVKEAKAAHVKAKADAKTAKVVTNASVDANKDKVNADYKVAAEKCDAMSGDAKSQCMTAAKARFGKS